MTCRPASSTCRHFFQVTMRRPSCRSEWELLIVLRRRGDRIEYRNAKNLNRRGRLRVNRVAIGCTRPYICFRSAPKADTTLPRLCPTLRFLCAPRLRVSSYVGSERHDLVVGVMPDVGASQPWNPTVTNWFAAQRVTQSIRQAGRTALPTALAARPEHIELQKKCC